MDEYEIKALEKETGFSRRILPDEWTHISEQYEEESKKYEAALMEYRKIIFLIGSYVIAAKT